MILNRNSLLVAAPIKNMLDHKISNGVVTSGMSEAGYDIRIKQEIKFSRNTRVPNQIDCYVDGVFAPCSRFTLASSIEEFQMPDNLTGIVHDKSSWARKGLSVFNTVIEPGWKGFLTLELVYFGSEELVIPAGSGIAQVIFHQNTDICSYDGRYQNQPDCPVAATNSKE